MSPQQHSSGAIVAVGWAAFMVLNSQALRAVVVALLILCFPVAVFAAPEGVLTGKVLVSGMYQQPRPLPVFKNRGFCGAAVPNETLMVAPDGALRNAVVTLVPLDRSVTVAPGVSVLDNQRCAFVPHVQVSTLGSELILKNSDPILHTVHARLGKETLFNVGLPHWRQVTKRLHRPGVVRIDCDVLHTWMSAAVVVVTTPYFAVTDGAGAFTIGGLAPGDYRVEVWHERLGYKHAAIRLAPGRPFSLEVVYSASTR